MGLFFIRRVAIYTLSFFSLLSSGRWESLHSFIHLLTTSPCLNSSGLLATGRPKNESQFKVFHDSCSLSALVGQAHQWKPKAQDQMESTGYPSVLTDYGLYLSPSFHLPVLSQSWGPRGPPLVS